MNSVHVFQSSRNAGPGGAPDHMTDEGMVMMASSPTSGSSTVTADVTTPRQQIVGFGAALTEASANVVSGLPMTLQNQILDAYYGPSGSGYTLARTHIGSCDFALSQYSYDDNGPDPTLANFSIAHDNMLLLPFLKAALAASNGALKILSSPWSAPGWMKDNGLMQGNGSDGSLQSQYYSTYAMYLSKYIQAYQAAGVPIWGITPQNEPMGVGGSREGMKWDEMQMNQFIRDDLGPQFAKDGVGGTKIFIYDHNKAPANVSPGPLSWATTILQDSATNPFVTGTAVHWYGTTFETDEDVLDAINALDPSKSILFDEGCADNLGAGGQSTSWMQDDYYWTKDEADWGYTYAAPDGTNPVTPDGTKKDHPIYEPIYRYERDLIVGLNHWYVGFIDWNAILDQNGGAGHIPNPVAAGILVDTNAQTAYYTPIYYAMQHVSRFILPQAKILTTTVSLASGVNATDYDGSPTQDGNALLATSAQNPDGSVAVVLFNETNAPIPYNVVISGKTFPGTIPAQAIQTLIWN
jgi:glucosylceramidase